MHCARAAACGPVQCLEMRGDVCLQCIIAIAVIKNDLQGSKIADEICHNTPQQKVHNA